MERQRQLPTALDEPLVERFELRGDQLAQLRGVVRKLLALHEHLTLVERLLSASLEALLLRAATEQRALVRPSLLEKAPREACLEQPSERLAVAPADALLQPVLVRHVQPRPERVTHTAQLAALLQAALVEAWDHLVDYLPHDRQPRSERGLLKRPDAPLSTWQGRLRERQAKVAVDDVHTALRHVYDAYAVVPHSDPQFLQQHGLQVVAVVAALQDEVATSRLHEQVPHLRPVLEDGQQERIALV